jgi:hypothetical protein
MNTDAGIADQNDATSTLGETAAVSSAAEALIVCPRPTDVLMPKEGYYLWAGNCRYGMAVDVHKQECLASPGRSEQARIALEIVHAVQKEGGRFSTAVEVPVSDTDIPNNTSMCRRLLGKL